MSTLNIIWSSINSLILILLPIIAKSWADKKLTKLKSSLSKGEFIHRLQFEKEFRIYSQLWKKLIILRNSTATIVHPITAKRQEESEEEDAREKEDRLRKVYNNYEEIEKMIINNKPFYSEKVYENAERILEESMKQIFGWHYPHEDINSHYTIALGRVKEISVIIDDIERAIRERIQNIGEAKIIG